MIQPTRLQKNSKIAVIGTSTTSEKQSIKNAELSLLEMGLEPILYPSCSCVHGYFSGTDAQRAQDLNQAFADPSIDGVFCLRGGYGAPRLLPLLDYEMMKKNPKVFLGYSDITALHVAFAQECNLITFHGPMPGSWKELNHFSLESLKRNLFTDSPMGLLENPQGESIECLSPGKASGILIGGNLSLLVSTLGSPYEINTKGNILFIEEVGEEFYRIDRMLNSLALAGKFRDCAGVVLGTWSGCNQDDSPKEATLTLDEIFSEIILPFGKPVINNLRAGHVDPQLTLPFGAMAELNATKGTLTIIESGVKI